MTAFRLQLDRLVENGDQFVLLLLGGQPGLRWPVDVGDGCDPDAAELPLEWSGSIVRAKRRGEREPANEGEGNDRNAKHYRPTFRMMKSSMWMRQRAPDERPLRPVP